MKNSPYDWLHRTGATRSSDEEAGVVPQKDVYRLPVKTVTMKIAREPEAPAHTPVGPRDGWKPGRAKSGPGESVRTMDGWNKTGGMRVAHDGWKGKSGKMRNAAEMAAAPSALVNSEASAKYKSVKSVKQEFNESPKYEKAEKKLFKGLKGSKKQVMRKGHNTNGAVSGPLATRQPMRSTTTAAPSGGRTEKRPIGAPRTMPPMQRPTPAKASVPKSRRPY